MRTRFAPSPSGYLHLGHAFSALTSWEQAQTAGGEFLLRIEDMDIARARPDFEAAIFSDLAWLGLRWPLPVMHQSNRRQAYESALDLLISKGVCYPCSCSRRDILAAARAPQEDGGNGPDGPVYPGTCRMRPMSARQKTDAIRLDMHKSVALLGGDSTISALTFQEIGQQYRGQHSLGAEYLISRCGDIVLARRDIGTSYHLSVVVDDAAQKITHVTRGADIFSASFIHRLLQALLGLPTPVYHHHRLIRDAAGKRLAKRDDARALRTFRAAGAGPADIRAMVGL